MTAELLYFQIASVTHILYHTVAIQREKSELENLPQKLAFLNSLLQDTEHFKYNFFIYTI